MVRRYGYSSRELPILLTPPSPQMPGSTSGISVGVAGGMKNVTTQPLTSLTVEIYGLNNTWHVIINNLIMRYSVTLAPLSWDTRHSVPLSIQSLETAW